MMCVMCAQQDMVTVTKRFASRVRFMSMDVTKRKNVGKNVYASSLATNPLSYFFGMYCSLPSRRGLTLIWPSTLGLQGRRAAARPR